MNYLVAATKSWNHRIYDEIVRRFPGTWVFIDKSQDLTVERVREIGPRYIFFMHWSWKVPTDIVNNFECVCFHMTDVPYGRGGSPLQNLILAGHRRTKLTALRMVEEFDAGPVYMKENLSLEGSAEEIYIRASTLSAGMIKRIIEENIVPIEQTGSPTIFKRRKPSQSEIPECTDLRTLYDFLRMLDAEGYPRAFLKHGGFRYEFSRASFHENRLVADVTITPEKTDEATA
jgi:methionyl-tRNA formyltransferase